MPEQFDVAIVGGGIAGLSLASFLALHRNVVVIEAEDALGYHATGRSAAEYTRRFHSVEAGRLTDASYDFLMTPPPGFTETPLLHHRGNLLIAGHDKVEVFEQVLAHELANPPAGGAPIERLSVAQAIEKVSFLDPGWLYGAFFDPDCWDIEVENLLQGYARTARGHGAQILQGTRIEEASHSAEGWVLSHKGGEIRARIVVNAGGAWADQFAELCGIARLNIIPHRRTAINVKVEGHDVFDMPEVNEIEEDFYFKPDAGQLFVSPSDETPMEPHDAWPDEMDIAYAAHYLDECSMLEITHVAHSWAGLRTLSPDRLPVIGFSVQNPDFFWLAGQGGYGIQTSPAVAQLATALLIGAGQPSHLSRAGVEAATFSPSRFKG